MFVIINNILQHLSIAIKKQISGSWTFLRYKKSVGIITNELPDEKFYLTIRKPVKHRRVLQNILIYSDGNTGDLNEAAVILALELVAMIFETISTAHKVIECKLNSIKNKINLLK